MPPAERPGRHRTSGAGGRWLAAIVAGGLLAGCGSASGGPPTGPSAALVSVAIAPASEYLKVGESLALTLTATLSDGSSRTVPGTWGNDAPSLVTVSTGGQLTGVAPGDVTVFANYQGQRATRLFHVVPDFGGVWSGGYRVVVCTDSGDWAGLCDDEDPATRWRLGLDFTQDRTLVRGDVLAFEGWTIPVEGSIGADGRLTASGAQTQADDLGDYVLAISDWTTRISGADEMTGTFAVVGTHTALAGEYRLSIRTDSLFRDGAQPARVRAPAIAPGRPAAAPRERR